MHQFITGLLLLLSAPAQSQMDARLVLLDGKELRAATIPKVDQKTNMIAFTDHKGVPMLISKNMVNWRATSRYLPDLVREVRPEAVGGATASTASKKRRGVAITNDALSKMSADQGMTGQWGGKQRTTKKSTNRKTSAAIISQLPLAHAWQLDQHLEGQRLVIFYFYADWSKASKKTTPDLEGLVRAYPTQLALKKVNIVKADSPITKHYKFKQVPYLRVLDAAGNVVNQGDGKTVISFLKESVGSHQPRQD